MVTLQSLPRTTRDGMSRKAISVHGGWSLTHMNGLKPPDIKKRGKKGSNTWENSNRIAKTKLMKNIAALNSGGGEPAVAGFRNRFQSKTDSKLSFEDTVEIMARRRNPESEITNKGLEEIENAAEDNKQAVRNRKKEEKIRQTVSNTKVPVHGTLRVKKKMTKHSDF